MNISCDKAVYICKQVKLHMIIYYQTSEVNMMLVFVFMSDHALVNTKNKLPPSEVFHIYVQDCKRTFNNHNVDADLAARERFVNGLIANKLVAPHNLFLNRLKRIIDCNPSSYFIFSFFFHT